MEQKIVNKDTIDILINNAEKTIIEFENILHNIEQIKSNLYNKNLSINYLQLFFELLSGSLSGIYEVCHSLKNMLSTDNIYVKRYHMQMINLSQYEWCIYLAGKDKKGILFKLINYLGKCNCSFSELKVILNKTKQLGKKCSVNLRNITTHYDKPQKIYSELVCLNDENIYALRISEQLLIHDMILKYASPILQDIQKLLNSNNHEVIYKKIDKFNVIDVLNNEISKAFNSKVNLYIIIKEQLLNAWSDIEKQKSNFVACDKIIKNFKLNKVDYNEIKDMQSVIEMYWSVCFMRYDLICSIDSYLNASSNIERSICFMRIFRIETSALTQLYGYNSEKKGKSIWNKLKMISVFKEIDFSEQLEVDFEKLVVHFDSKKRNLYTHYRENEKFNISDRWQCFNSMNHSEELMQVLKLIALCKNINKYLLSFILLMNRNEKLKSDEIIKNMERIIEYINVSDL